MPPVELLVPIARRAPIAFGPPGGLPRHLSRLGAHTVVLRGKWEADVLSQIFGGRSATPQQEIVIVGPDGRTPIMVAGLGVTEVSELEETIHEAVERGEERMQSYGTMQPFDEYRERRGMPSREKVDEMTREAMRRAAKTQNKRKST